MAIHFAAALFAVLVVAGQILFKGPGPVFGTTEVSLPLNNHAMKSKLVMVPTGGGKAILNYEFSDLSELLNPEDTSDPLLLILPAHSLETISQQGEQQGIHFKAGGKVQELAFMFARISP